MRHGEARGHPAQAYATSDRAPPNLSMLQTESGHPNVVRRAAQPRGEVLLATKRTPRDLARPFITPADVEQIFREAQRIARGP